MATKPHSSRKTAWHTNNMRGRRRNTARMQHPTSSLKSKNTHTNLPSYFFQSREMGLFDSLNWDVTGCVSSSTGNPLVSDTQWVCVCVCACVWRHADVREETLHNLLCLFSSVSCWSLHLCQLWDRQQAKQKWQQCSPVVKYNKHKQTHTCNQFHRSGCVYHHLLVPIEPTVQEYLYFFVLFWHITRTTKGVATVCCISPLDSKSGAFDHIAWSSPGDGDRPVCRGIIFFILILKKQLEFKGNTDKKYFKHWKSEHLDSCDRHNIKNELLNLSWNDQLVNRLARKIICNHFNKRFIVLVILSNKNVKHF